MFTPHPPTTSPADADRTLARMYSSGSVSSAPPPTAPSVPSDADAAPKEGDIADPFVGCGLGGVRRLKNTNVRHSHDYLAKAVFGDMMM